jgi:predicted secreted protein
MGTTLGVAIYVVIWWTVLFAVLPIGVRTQGEEGEVVPGTPASAPVSPRLLRVLALTTLLAALLFAAFLVAIRYGTDVLQRLGWVHT